MRTMRQARVVPLMLAAFAGTAAAMGIEGALVFPPIEQHTHGSSIAELPNGDLLTVWFQGSGERQADDVQLMGARRKPGSAWSAPFPMADTPGLPDCNPVLFLDPRGTLWLFWVAIQNNEWGGALLKCRTATQLDGDGAPAWAWQEVIHVRPQRLDALFPPVAANAREALAPILAVDTRLKEEIDDAERKAGDKLHSRIGWMTRVQPIMTGGRLLLGLYSDVFNCSLAAWTDDFGATWSAGEPILDPEAKYIGNVQPSFVEKRDGTIVAFMRDNGLPNYVRTAASSDRGQTWSRLGMLKIRESGASVQCVRLASGRWLLVNNDLIDGRHRLGAHLSDDEGATWKWGRALEEAEKGAGSFSYPSVIQAKDGSIHATFSHSRAETKGESIKHVRFGEDWLLEAPLANPL